MAVVIGRPINGIPLNGNEYVCNAHGNTLYFKDTQAAKEFLYAASYTDDDIENECIVFEEINIEDKEETK